MRQIKTVKNVKLKLKLINIFIMLMLLSSKTLSASHTSIDNKLTDYITCHQQAQLELLKKLVNINSGTTNLAGVHQVGALLSQKFQALGFTVHWADTSADRQRAGTLIAKHAGNKGKKLLLIGHLDTVFAANSTFQHFKRTNNLATGPGIIDDKGGDVVIVYALNALFAANLLKDADITVVLTGDEEDSAKPVSISRKPLIDAAKNADIALDFEWAITQDTATIARRGISQWTLEAQGSQAHSSTIFQEKTGFGAIYELARILNTIRLDLASKQYLSFSPGIILGGTAISYDKTKAQGKALGKANVIAKTAFAKGDLRFLTEKQRINAEEKIVAAVSAHLPVTKASIVFQSGMPAMPPTLANLALLKKYSQASIKLGFGPVNQLSPGLRGAGDISHIASQMSASLAGLGPVGTGAHSDKESLDISSLSIQTKRAALLIYRLINEK